MMETLTIDIEQAGKEALRGDMLMVGVYGQGVGGPVDIMVAIDRADIAEVINDFTDRFSKWDPMAMAKVALRVMLLVGQLPPDVQVNVIAPALLLASSTPDGIDGAMGIEVTIRKKSFLVEIFDLANLKTSGTVH